MIRATGHPRHFVATFRHKFQGTWEGRAGTAQIPTSLVVNPYYKYPVWKLDGHVLWPNDDKRSLRDIQTNENAIGFYIGNSESWRLELSSDGNRLTGKGRKYVYDSDTGEREAVYYDVDLRRQ